MLTLDRRVLLRAGSAGVGAAALAPTSSALAHAPQAGKQAQPGFYHFKLGQVEITVVSDGSSRSRQKRRGAIGPRTQEAYSHPHSTRLGRKLCKSTPPSSTPATSWC
jgi:hypothetical protein